MESRQIVDKVIWFELRRLICAKKKTHEEYVAEVAAVNPNIEVIEKYVDSHTKIMHKCKIDGYEWMVLPLHILRGSGCPVCAGVKNKTHEEYVEEVTKINSNIEVVGIYVNNNTKILHRCKIDGYEWAVSPSSILSGSGCPKCCGGVKKTHEYYVNELSIKNPSIIVVGKYINAATKILHKCLKDGYEWFATPSNVLSGKGCPVCGGTIKKTHKQYVDELELKAPFVIPIEQYINNSTKIMHKCLVHNYIWEVTPNNVLNGCGCPICKNEKLSNKFKRSHEEYVKALFNINKSVVVVEKYINARTAIKHRCLVCGWEWDVRPDALLSGHGCPQCNSCNKSKGEKIIADWLDNHEIAYETQKTFDNCKDKHLLRFDFYLPDYNILIEYNGKQHYEPIDYFGGQKAFDDGIKRDKIKENYCKNNNINLFKIPYFAVIHNELDMLFKQYIVKEVAA